MKRKSKKDKIRVYAAGIVALLVVLTFVLFSITIIRKGQVIFGSFSLIVAAVIFIFAIFILKRHYKAVKEGFPYQDERSKKIMILAGYYAFLISIWFILILSWIVDAELLNFRDIQQALGFSILGMAIIFGICWIFVSRKNTDKAWS